MPVVGVEPFTGLRTPEGECQALDARPWGPDAGPASFLSR